MIWLFEIVEIGFSDQINTKGPNEFDKARPETVILLSNTPALLRVNGTL